MVEIDFIGSSEDFLLDEQRISFQPRLPNKETNYQYLFPFILGDTIDKISKYTLESDEEIAFALSIVKDSTVFILRNCSKRTLFTLFK